MHVDQCTDTDLCVCFQLHLAVRGRHKEVVRYLMDKKADPNIINANGKRLKLLKRFAQSSKSNYSNLIIDHLNTLKLIMSM